MQGLLKFYNIKKKKLALHQVFLFNNLILIASLKKKKKHDYKLVWWSPISEVTIVDLSDDESKSFMVVVKILTQKPLQMHSV